VIILSKQKKDNSPENIFEDEKGVAAVQNQLNESYQSGVVEQLHNNKNIHTFNNRRR
jgi:hypothetical protein